jgi:hypothetical protein
MGAKYLPSIKDQKAIQRFHQQQQAVRARQKELAQELSRAKKEKRK